MATVERLPLGNGEAPATAQLAMRSIFTSILIACLLTCLLAGCGAHDVRVHYPLSMPTEPTGTLVLQLTQPADDVTVALNGVLVVDKVHTQHVVIENVPIGTAEIILAANGGDKEFKVWVGSDHATTVPLGIPDTSSGFIKTLAGTLITILVYSLLHR